MGSKALVSAAFTKKLTSLEALRQKIHRGHFALASAYIDFAEQFVSLLDEAKAQDEASGTKVHEAEVLALGTLDGTQLVDGTISKWRKIASEADELKKNQEHLPSSRDALYFIALGVEKGVKISRLASRGELTSESSLSEIKKLIPSDKRKPKPKSRDKSHKGGATITVGTDIHGFSPIALGISANGLPTSVQKLLNKGSVLLRVRVEIDPDTNRPMLVAVGYGQ